ncbi:MAG: LacI family DNA-binding transcriptional regulator [Fibrobacterota bacterium]
MPTRDDVARLAKVSTATVSRAYNNPGSVSSEKVKRIREAAKKLRYLPDKNASALRRNGSGAIALIETSHAPSFTDRYYAWHYATVLRAVKSVIDKTLYHLLLITVSSPDDIRALARNRVCDAVIAHDLRDTRLMNAVRGLGLPYVCAYRNLSPGLNIVYIDEVHGGRLAGQRLVSAGCQRPAHITGSLNTNPVCRDRFDGFKNAFPNTPIKLIDGEIGIRGGYASSMQLIPQIHAKEVDSLFVVNDLTAIGVFQAFSEAGVRVPQDISVIGYDNLPFIDTLPVKLTTVDISLGAAYQRASHIILELIKEKRPIQEPIKPVLVEGETVITPKKGATLE